MCGAFVWGQSGHNGSRSKHCRGISHRLKRHPNFSFRINAKSSKSVQKPQPANAVSAAWSRHLAASERQGESCNPPYRGQKPASANAVCSICSAHHIVSPSERLAAMTDFGMAMRSAKATPWGFAAAKTDRVDVAPRPACRSLKSMHATLSKQHSPTPQREAEHPEQRRHHVDSYEHAKHQRVVEEGRGVPIDRDRRD